MKTRSFYTEVKEVLTMPDYVDKAVVMQWLFKSWAGESPVIDEVLAGKTMFVVEAKPLINENLAVCNFVYNSWCTGPIFEAKAKQVNARMGKVLDRGSLDRLSQKVKFPWSMTLFLVFLTFATIIMVAAEVMCFHTVTLTLEIFSGVVAGVLSLVIWFFGWLLERDKFINKRLGAECLLSNLRWLDAAVNAFRQPNQSNSPQI